MSPTTNHSLVIPELLQGQWTSAIICTFTANLTFFETRLVSQLAQVPLRAILADTRQLTEKFGEAARTNQRHRLANKAYVAAPIRHPHAAHGKMMLLLGPTAGRLIVGSGNLGYDGYAAPGELWHVFEYTDEEPRHVSEFGAARAFIDGLATRRLIDPPIVELVHTAWSKATWLPPSPPAPPSMTSNLDRALIDQLRDAATDPVEELVVHAPFHDADCAALQQLIVSFKPSRVRLLVTVGTSADPEAIQRVLATASKATVEHVYVKDEPAAFIHAKWVHLKHRNSETLLTGSANLSRSALLRSAHGGNIEIGIISSGPVGAFGALYAHLNHRKVADISSLGLAYRGNSELQADEVATYPVVQWSRLDGPTLTLVFDRDLPDATTLELDSHAGEPLSMESMSLDAAIAVVSLTSESAELVAEGGRVHVRLDGDDALTSDTWPYQLGHLRSRLDKASERKYLHRLGNLPQQDAELLELLNELDQTLIIDRESVWRVARPGVSLDPTPAGSDPVHLEDLDWERVRRDLRYSAYFIRGRTSELAPTDIQVALAAIAGRLGDLGLNTPGAEAEDERDLANEADTDLSAEAEDTNDELQDELTRRRLPISTRTRMAFDRFVRRYAAALGDTAFIAELGPLPAVSNAVVFNHLLAQLLDREAASPRHVIHAQAQTWRFLWGGPDRPGIAHDLDDASADGVAGVLTDAAAKATTLRGLVTAFDYDVDEPTAAALRDIARHLLTDRDFGLDADLMSTAAGGDAMAAVSLNALAHSATLTPGEVLDFVLAPYGIARSSAEWRRQPVNRRDRGTYQADTFVIGVHVDGLTPERARELLERVAVAAYYAGHDGAYVRLRFEGNGKAVAFWDDDAGSGVVMIDDEIEFASFDPPWPDWSIRLDQLDAVLRSGGRTALRSA